MKRGDTVFVPLLGGPGKKKTKPVYLLWPGTIAKLYKDHALVEFNQPWRDGTTSMKVERSQLR